SQETDMHQIGRNLGGQEPKDADKITRLTTERRYREDFVRTIQAETHLRPALALGCLCFAAVGCPIGIWFSKSDYMSAFVTCFLPIVIVYYPLIFCMNDLGRSGKIPAWMGIYNADLLMLLAGAVLFRRLSRN